MVLRLRRSGLRSAASDQGLYLRFGQRRRHRLVAGEVQATASIEHGTSGGNDRCELEHSYRVANVRVDGFHPSLHEVGLMPEPCTSRIADELGPPLAMWF